VLSAVAALAVMPSGVQPAAAAAAGPPAITSSFYVYGSFVDVCGLDATTECPLYNYAASQALAPAGGMTILDFGAPCFEPATLALGTQLFNSQSCTPDSTVVILAQAWLRGYQTNPKRSAAQPYVLVVGTSNSLTASLPGNAMTAAEMARHGEAWFKSVVDPTEAVAQSLPSHATIWAGNDIEQSSDGNWYDGATTSAWVDAYAAASGATKPCVPTRSGLLVDYGDYVPNRPGWSPAAVYHVAWQAAPACPMPEIYYTVNVAEWLSLNSYAEGAGLPQLHFTGVLSEDGAAGTLSSLAAWNALGAASGQAAPYLSVIGETGPIPPEVPDAPSAVTASSGPGLVNVSWSAPAWDGGAAVTSYTITVYEGSNLAQLVILSAFPAPEKAVLAGLAEGASYTFYVSANNRVGTSPKSLPSRTVEPSALVPSHRTTPG